MVKKVKTMDLKGNDYAKVSERIKAFRSENPNGVIKTEMSPVVSEDGGKVIAMTVKAIIKKDAKKEGGSAEGSSYGTSADISKQKGTEKLETIAVGRALAFLGYASDGEIASSEEMEEFMSYQKERKDEIILQEESEIKQCKNIEELKTVWAKITMKTELEDIKNLMKASYENS
jgi:hypothetical protein